VCYGILAAAFFAVSFVVNRALATEGGAWEWTACLRYLIALPMIAAIVAIRRNLREVAEALRAEPWAWMLWSTVGFVVFYAPLCYAASTAPGWVVAATFQVTIVCGMLAAPLIYTDHRRRIPPAALAVSVLILIGVALVEVGRGDVGGVGSATILGVLAGLLAAVAYPVGNRKTLLLAGNQLDSWQRLLAMSIACLPAWLVITAIAAARHGAPSADQFLGTLIVAVSSGLIATALFFTATRRSQHEPTRLAAVEATQAFEVALVAVAEPVILRSAPPQPLAWTGIAVITAGVIGYTALGRPRARPRSAEQPDILA
jgi:drug/metabolite transporter (DMT)-like permease